MFNRGAGVGPDASFFWGAVMKEIKFRIWNVVGQCMHDWRELVEKNKIHLLAHQQSGYPVMQYTGLKDANGVEIYEGDIIRYVQKSTIETITRPVVFIDGSFVVQESENCDMHLCGICSDQNHNGSHIGFVIGNIYQNQELLK